MDDGSSLCTLSAHLWMMGQVYALSVFCTFFLFIVYFICLKKYMYFLTSLYIYIGASLVLRHQCATVHVNVAHLVETMHYYMQRLKLNLRHPTYLL